MYAVIETGGKQYRVAPGDVIDVEHLPIEEDQAEVTFDRVLMVREGDVVTVGAPLVEGASVTATVVDAVRGKKIIVFKMKRRKGYRRRNGHRQELHRVKIESIAAAAPTKKAKPAKKAEAPAEAEPAAKAEAAEEKVPAKKAATKKAAAAKDASSEKAEPKKKPEQAAEAETEKTED